MKAQIKISGKYGEVYKLFSNMNMHKDHHLEGSYCNTRVLNYKSRAAAISDIKAAYRQLKNEGAVISRDRTQLFYGDSKAVLININQKPDKIDVQGSIRKQENL
jgi:uncharacterized glyoxalase superfamily protein PhnB